ncbi:hypothetical protein AB0G74_33595 [Streptomyces sp. NPDC020875]|uniref:hypothetical protein n=1 Tax=Streptomyces sp. NPDC020875 TaxID=3154898 RepID=UPI0033C9103D
MLEVLPARVDREAERFRAGMTRRCVCVKDFRNAVPETDRTGLPYQQPHTLGVSSATEPVAMSIGQVAPSTVAVWLVRRADWTRKRVKNACSVTAVSQSRR